MANDSRYSNYQEALIEIGNWSLRRKKEGDIRGDYNAMIAHQCSRDAELMLINGEISKSCPLCGQEAPDEIRGLWWLLCNDQYRGFNTNDTI